nr:uncharacterized protein LOC119185468 [Rhipicephalus microplus]
MGKLSGFSGALKVHGDVEVFFVGDVGWYDIEHDSELVHDGHLLAVQLHRQKTSVDPRLHWSSLGKSPVARFHGCRVSSNHLCEQLPATSLSKRERFHRVFLPVLCLITAGSELLTFRLKESRAKRAQSCHNYIKPSVPLAEHNDSERKPARPLPVDALPTGDRMRETSESSDGWY